jgi:hypothetical protein
MDADGHRKGRRRWIGAAVLALIVLVGVAIGLAAISDDRGGRNGDGGTDLGSTELTETYSDRLGWSIDYPEGWYVLPIDQFTGRFSLQGAAFSNEPLTPESDAGFGGSPVPNIAALTHDAVVLVVTHRSGGPAPSFGDDSAYPLDPADARVDRRAAPASSFLQFRGDGLGDFTVQFGGHADAPPTLRETLDRMIRTIRFEPWELGEVRNGSAAVSTDLPDGTGEIARVEDAGFVAVMKFSGRTYALDVPDVNCGGQRYAWDPVTRQILLTGTCFDDVRYDARGIPDPSNPPRFLEPLERHPIYEAWDGTALVALGVVLAP